MSARRLGIGAGIVGLCVLLVCVCLIAVFLDLMAALWLLESTLVVALAVRLLFRRYSYFAARSLTFDLIFLLCLIFALALVIPYAQLPSPV